MWQVLVGVFFGVMWRKACARYRGQGDSAAKVPPYLSLVALYLGQVRPLQSTSTMS